MAVSPPPRPGRIFISYRREETAYPAGWLYDRLADRFGSGQVFKDVDSIELGDDFVEVITSAVAACDVLLALIGEEWLTITDAHGRRRLDDPDDFVRLEIEAALARNVRVIPILVDGASMPRVEELPASLAGLVRRQALELHPARFDFDTSRLLKVLDKTLGEARTGRDKAPEWSEQAGQPSDKRRRRRSTRKRVLTGTGVTVVPVLLIVVIFANSATTRSPTGAVSPSPSAEVATTSSAGGTTTSPAANAPVFRDDFSSRAAGWDGEGAVATGAGYTGGAYRISAPPAASGSGASSLPMKASRVYPSAPPRIRIAVQGRRVPTSDQSMEYGILCRMNDADAYVLTVSDGYASIAKWGRYKLLKEAYPQLDANSTNELQAVCTGGSGRQAVHLELWVNGEKVVETTDRARPLPPGAVGLAIGTNETTRASVAEFDNFVVEQVA